MSSDVIIGHDGKPRCGWAGAGDTALGRYHDRSSASDETELDSTIAVRELGEGFVRTDPAIG